MGVDGAGEDISQKMECVNGNIFQYVYTNRNCSDEPFKTNDDIYGYCDGVNCQEYSEVKTYLNESCSNVDGWLILPMLMHDCYQYNFGEGNGQSFKFLCDITDKKISLGIFNSKDCSDSRYLSYDIYKDKTCIDGEYAEILTCPTNNTVELSTLIGIMVTIIIILAQY